MFAIGASTLSRQRSDDGIAGADEAKKNAAEIALSGVDWLHFFRFLEAL